MSRLSHHSPWILFVLLLAGCPQGIDTTDDPPRRKADSGVPDAGGSSDTGPVDSGPFCGNDLIEDQELCDGNSVNSSCWEERLPLGTLKCASGCESYDTSGCNGCLPNCDQRQCGLDPNCNVSCGTCDKSLSCSNDGRCLAECLAGTSTCTPDGFGYQGCGYNPVSGLFDYGPRVACQAPDACVAGGCDRSACVPGEILFIVDRSASMSSNAVWHWVTDKVLTTIDTHQHSSKFGLREFPSDTACATGPIHAPALSAYQALSQLITPPSAEASSPIAAALSDLEAVFATGMDSRAIVLLTDGDETCNRADEAEELASRLFRAGIELHVIALSTSANPAFLDRLARAGGTSARHTAAHAIALERALNAVMSDIGACSNPQPHITTGYYHSCAILENRTLSCWGRQQDGISSPPSGTFVALSASTENTCAIRTNGTIACWGRGDTNQNNHPSGNDFVQVTGGNEHQCALRENGTVLCWGDNTDGQATPPADTFKQITAGGFFTCGIRTTDEVDCWGAGVVEPTGAFEQISGGAFSLCGIRADDTIWCSSAAGIPPGTFVQVDAGSDHKCALEANGDMTCWGQNHLGQSTPLPGTYLEVSVNNEHTCAVRYNHDIACWGSDSNGQVSVP